LGRFCWSKYPPIGSAINQRFNFWRFREANHQQELIGGVVEPTPLKNDGVKVSWEYKIPN